MLSKCFFVLATLLLIHWGVDVASAGPFDKSGVGANGEGVLGGDGGGSSGLIMGIVFDTTIPPPHTRGARAINQIEALKNLIRDHLKVGDYLFIQSVSRGYNGFFIASGGSGEGIWSGGPMLTPTRISSVEEETSGNDYAGMSAKSKQSLLDWVEDLEQRENVNDPTFDFNDSTTGHPSMQGAIYMARHFFHHLDGVVANSPYGYKKVLFVFSDGHFVGSVNPVIRNPDEDEDLTTTLSLQTLPLGDWHLPTGNGWRNDDHVQVRATRQSSGCTADQAENSGLNSYYQCFDYWNNTHRKGPVPLPTSMDTSEEFENSIYTRYPRYGIDSYSFDEVNHVRIRRSLYWDAVCGSDPSANALAAEQADLARAFEGVATIYGYVPDSSPQPQYLAAMQRITWDDDLPECWVRAPSQGLTPCGNDNTLVFWRFNRVYSGSSKWSLHDGTDILEDLSALKDSDHPEKGYNICGGYGSGNQTAYIAGDFVKSSSRINTVFTSPDFGDLETTLRQTTNQVRAIRLIRSGSLN